MSIIERVDGFGTTIGGEPHSGWLPAAGRRKRAASLYHDLYHDLAASLYRGSVNFARLRRDPRPDALGSSICAIRNWPRRACFADTRASARLSPRIRGRYREAPPNAAVEEEGAITDSRRTAPGSFTTFRPLPRSAQSSLAHSPGSPAADTVTVRV